MADVNQNDHELERLRNLLREDGGINAPDMAGLASVLHAWRAPEATPDSTAHLLARLTPELPEPAMPRWRLRLLQVMEWWPLLLLRSQVRVVRGEIWAASALVIALGTLVTLGSYRGGAAVLTFIAPIVAAVGVAFLYDSEIEQILELEASTPASSRMLLLARLSLIFGFDLGIGLLGSLALALFRADVLLWPLVASWLVPMTFLSALAFCVSVVSRDALAGSVVGLVIWGFHVLLSIVPGENLTIYLLSLPGLSAPEHRPFLLLTAFILVAVALWLGGSTARTERRSHS